MVPMKRKQTRMYYKNTLRCDRIMRDFIHFSHFFVSFYNNHVLFLFYD